VSNFLSTRQADRRFARDRLSQAEDRDFLEHWLTSPRGEAKLAEAHMIMRETRYLGAFN
jgi:hypothetical protein